MGPGRGSPPALVPGCDAATRDGAFSRQKRREARAEALEDLLFGLAVARQITADAVV